MEIRFSITKQFEGPVYHIVPSPSTAFRHDVMIYFSVVKIFNNKKVSRNLTRRRKLNNNKNHAKQNTLGSGM